MAMRQLSVIASDQWANLTADLFSTFGAISVAFEDAADQPLYEPRPGETPIWKNAKVTALFAEDIDLHKVREFLSEHIGDEHISGWTLADLADQPWERAWLKHFQPLKFGKSLWICATGQKPPDSESVVLTLDPGLAFGTGTHPTTALCLDWLADANLQDAVMVDYGCGSGILAIAAVLLGARKAYAVDIDPQALTACRENARKNDVETRIACCEPQALPVLKADVVVANILANPLIDLLPVFAELTDIDNKIVLSGILEDQANTVRCAYESKFELFPTRIRKDWALLQGTRKADTS